MLKHVHLSPTRSPSAAGGAVRPDSLGLDVSQQQQHRELEHFNLSCSRSSSCLSLNDSQSSSVASSGTAGASSQGGGSLSSQPPHSQQHGDSASVAVKIYARCLRSDIEYKTLGVSYSTTSKQLVSSLLGKYRMKHRDPNLFYLTMELGLRSTGTEARTVLVLDDDSKPAQLQACRPNGESRFVLRMREGGLVRIYDGVLMQGSYYKSLLVSDGTGTEELLRLILNCNNCPEPADRFCLMEVCRTDRCERRLQPEDRPVQMQAAWRSRDSSCFVLQRCQPARPPRRLPWRPRPDPARPHSPAKSAGSVSYHDYENYFYI